MKTCKWIFAGLAALSPLAVFSVEVDAIAAVVGKESILRSDVLAEMRRARAAESDYPVIRNRMIDRKLILRSAEQSKMTMQDWVVENRIREIISRAFGGDRNKLLEALSRDRLPYSEWRARIREDMIVSAMRWNVVDKNVTARPEDMRREFEAHADRYAEDSTVSVSVILLKPEDAVKRDEVSAAIGSDGFEAVARRYSADSHASEGGAWTNIIARDVFKPQICAEIDKMPRGTISRWIELDGWSFLLRKDAETRGKPRTFEEAYDDIEAAVKDNEAKAAYDAWIGRLRDETYIKVY